MRILALAAVLLLALGSSLFAHTPEINLSIRQQGSLFLLTVAPSDEISRVSFKEEERVICLDDTGADGFECNVTNVLADRESHEFIAEITALDGDISSAILTAQLTAAGTLLGQEGDCTVNKMTAAVFPKRIEISGSCTPDSSIELTIESDPIVKRAKADERGNFTVSVTETLNAGIHKISGNSGDKELKAAISETAFCVGTKDECVALGYDGKFVVEEPDKVANRVYTFILIAALLLSSSLIMVLKRTRIGA